MVDSVATRCDRSKSESLLSNGEAIRYFPFMSIRDNRLVNLRALHHWLRVEIGGGTRVGAKTAASAALSARLPVEGEGAASPIYISQLVRGYKTQRDARTRTPSEALCAAIEKAFVMPSGWMSKEHDDPTGDLDRILRSSEASAVTAIASSEHFVSSNQPDLSGDEQELVDSFRLLPAGEQRDVLRDLVGRAARYREVVERLMSGSAAQLPPSNVSRPQFSANRGGRLIQGPPGKDAPAAGGPRTSSGNGKRGRT